MTFLETVRAEFDRMRARSFAVDGYEGVTHAGVLVVARDSGAALLAQRALDESDAPDVAETWEMPGGSLEDGEDPFSGASREFSEEVGIDLPEGEVVHGWRAGPEDNYQGFVYAVDEQFAVDPDSADPEEVQNVLWVTPEGAKTLNLRPEFAKMDLAALIETAVSGNRAEKEDVEMATEPELDDEAVERIGALVEEPAFDLMAMAAGPIPIHGVIAPEETESGDGRAFTAGSMTSRPLRIPFRWQKADIGGHDGAVVTGSVDRIMRKDGLIHWEGLMMATPEADELVDVIAFFGRFGVSVDGDRGGLDDGRSESSGITWFNAVRAAGLTAVAIPAFAEAYVALGPHPDMPTDETEEALVASGIGTADIAGMQTFKRGPGWVTNPKETKRLHAYWTSPGQPGYEKIGWGTSGDWTRCTVLVGEKIAENSPEKLRFIKNICAEWHNDALGYWPGELGKPGNAPDTPENRRRAATHASLDEIDNEGIEATDEGWEAVLVSSVTGERVKPPVSYFHRHESTEALTIEDPDENGIIRTYGYAGEWGVCHVGMSGQCVEPPMTGSDDYPEFHLGRTRTAEGFISTGVLTYGVGHRSAKTILSESPDQAYFDNVNNAWAAVRVGEDERGIWFSGVVLPGVDPDHLVKIEASGQVSGEWLAGAMRACLTVNVPGFPVQRASAEYDENGNVVALAASAFGSVAGVNEIEKSECFEIEPTPAERMFALRKIDAEERFQKLRSAWARNEERVV